MMTAEEARAQLVEPELVFPPPPKTVEVWNPHVHSMVPVFAYGHRKDVDEPLQRVRWNMAEGRWEIDPERAKWGKQRPGANSKAPWTLVTIWPAEMKRPPSKSTLTSRVEELERQVACLLKTFGLDETDVAELESLVTGEETLKVD